MRCDEWSDDDNLLMSKRKIKEHETMKTPSPHPSAKIDIKFA